MFLEALIGSSVLTGMALHAGFETALSGYLSTLVLLLTAAIGGNVAEHFAKRGPGAS